MISVTKDSDFESLISKTNSFLGELQSAGQNIVSLASDLSSAVGSLDFSAWNDELGQATNTYANQLKESINVIGQDKGVSSLSDICNALIANLSNCAVLKNEIDKLNTIISNTPKTITFTVCNGKRITQRNESYYNLVSQRDYDDAQLGSCVEQCNSVISYFPSVVISGEAPKLNLSFGGGTSAYQGVQYTPVEGTQQNVSLDGKDYTVQTVTDSDGNEYYQYTPTDGGDPIIVRKNGANSGMQGQENPTQSNDQNQDDTQEQKNTQGDENLTDQGYPSSTEGYGRNNGDDSSENSAESGGGSSGGHGF